MKHLVLIFVGILFLSGCSTQFTGNAHTSKQVCMEKCAGQNMMLAGMVYMGEYTSGCICRAKGGHVTKTVGLNEKFFSAAASSTVGVVLQTRMMNQNAHNPAMMNAGMHIHHFPM